MAGGHRSVSNEAGTRAQAPAPGVQRTPSGGGDAAGAVVKGIIIHYSYHKYLLGTFEAPSRAHSRDNL